MFKQLFSEHGLRSGCASDSSVQWHPGWHHAWRKKRSTRRV